MRRPGARPSGHGWVWNLCWTTGLPLVAGGLIVVALIERARSAHSRCCSTASRADEDGKDRDSRE